MAMALIAGATVTVTLVDVGSVGAASVPFSITTGGSDGTAFVDALYGTGGCTGGVYEAGWDWATDGTLTGRNQAPTFTPTATQPTSGSAIPSNGCGAVTTLHLETYPNLNAYDPWSGTFGGTNSQLTSGKAPFPNFGAVPVPSVGATPPGSAYPAFRITGNIIASTPIPNDRVITDMFQVGCEAPDVCIQMVPSSTGAPVGGFVTGKNHGGTCSQCMKPTRRFCVG